MNPETQERAMEMAGMVGVTGVTFLFAGLVYMYTGLPFISAGIGMIIGSLTGAAMVMDEDEN